MSKRLVILLLVLIFGLPVLLSKLKNLLPDPTQPVSRYALTKREAESKLKTAEQALHEVQQLLREHHYQNARLAYYAICDELNTSLHQAGDMPLSNNQRLSGELNRLDGIVLHYALAELQALETRIAAGDPNTADVRRLLRSFALVGGVDLNAELAKFSPKMSDRRAAAASRWIRVEIDGDRDELETTAEEHFAQIIAVPRDCKLAYGPALTPAEANATFAVIKSKLRPDWRGYQRSDTIKPMELAKPDVSYLSGLSGWIQLEQQVHTYRPSWVAHYGPHPEIPVALKLAAVNSLALSDREDVVKYFADRNRVRFEEVNEKLAQMVDGLPRLTWEKL